MHTHTINNIPCYQPILAHYNKTPIQTHKRCTIDKYTHTHYWIELNRIEWNCIELDWLERKGKKKEEKGKEISKQSADIENAFRWKHLVEKRKFWSSFTWWWWWREGRGNGELGVWWTNEWIVSRDGSNDYRGVGGRRAGGGC